MEWSKRNPFKTIDFKYTVVVLLLFSLQTICTIIENHNLVWIQCQNHLFKLFHFEMKHTITHTHSSTKERKRNMNGIDFATFTLVWFIISSNWYFVQSISRKNGYEVIRVVIQINSTQRKSRLRCCKWIFCKELDRFWRVTGRALYYHHYTSRAWNISAKNRNKRKKENEKTYNSQHA